MALLVLVSFVKMVVLHTSREEVIVLIHVVYIYIDEYLIMNFYSLLTKVNP